MSLSPFTYVEAQNVGEASGILHEDEEALLIAGGTVVVPMLRHRLLRPTTLVSIADVPHLDRIDVVDDGSLRVGALVTHRTIAQSELVHRHLSLLASACGRVATPAIRNMGTLGGNLAYAESASDPPAALLALGATVRLDGRNGPRDVPIESWFSGFYATARSRDEIVVGVDVPIPPEDTIARYLKWNPRSAEDKPLVGLALVLREERGTYRSVRLAVSGAGETPQLLSMAAAVLEGADLNQKVIEGVAEAAATEVAAFDDLQGSAAYRRSMLRVWVRRLLDSVREDSGA